MSVASEIYEEWAALAGLACTCPPDCTTGDRWGDGPRQCTPTCEPCRRMRHKPYRKPPETKTGATP